MNAHFLLHQFIAVRKPVIAGQSMTGKTIRNASTFRYIMIFLILILFGGINLELNAQSFSATLSSNQKFAKPLPASYACGGTYGSFTSINSSSTLFSYATQAFTVSTAGNYTIEVTSSTASDPMLYIYTSFSPSSPNSNFKVGDDDSGAGLLSKIGACGNNFSTGTYVIVVTAYNSATTSGTVNFTISGAGTTTVMPTVTTASASSVSSSSAVLGGNVTADGGATVTSRGVAYGTSSNPTSGTSIGSGTGSFSETISGLTPGTLYYARAYATNSVGTNYGPQVTFTTQNFTPPSVTTNNTTSIERTTATFNGNVGSTGGQNVSAGFQVSTNSSFSGATSVTSTSSMGTGNFSYAYSGLTGSTLYYVRAWASNNGGTTYASSTSFYTDHTITYTANANGSITGTTTQYIDHNGTTSAVTAVPNSGYHFLRWSDNSTSNPRSDAGITSSFSRSATFEVNSLEFTSQPGTTIAGQGINFTVRIKNSYSNTMTNSDRTITVALASNPAGGALAGTLTATSVNGVASFTLPYIQKTGVYTITVSASGLTSATSSSFTIIPAALSYFTVDNVTTPHEAGQFTSPRVTAYDIYNNIKTNYTGTVSFSTNNVSVNPAKATVLPANYTFASSDNGVKTFANQMNLKQYGTGYYVRVNDGTAQGEQTNIQVTSAPLNFYTIKANSNYPTHPADNNVLAGTTFSVTAYLYDEFGNLKLDFTGGLDVTFTTNANPSPLGNPAVLASAASRTFTNGVSIISGFTFYNAQETPTITIVESMTGSAGTTPVITVWPEVLANFLVKEEPVQSHSIGGVRVISNESFSVKVTARDQYNNIKRDYVGHINFKSSNDAIVQFPNGLQNFTLLNNGIRTFTNAISIPTTGSYWLRVADSPDAFKTGELQNIVVGPNVQNAGNSELFFASYPSVTTYPSTPEVVAGDFINVTIRPRDAGNNLLCDCQTVSVMLNGQNTHRNGALESGVPALVTIPVVDNHDGTYSALVRVADMAITNVITASVNGTVLTDQLNVVVNQPDLASLATSVITADPTAITADEFSVVTVQLRDQFLNNRSTDDGTVNLTITNLTNGIILGETTGSSNIEVAYTTAGKYVATFRMNGIGLGTATIVGAFTNGVAINGSIVDNADIVVTHGVATQLAVITQPSSLGNAVAGIAFDRQPVIHINDQWGNHVTTGAGSSLDVSAIKETGNSTLKGTLTATAAAGVATFGNLNYELAESGVSIEFSATGITEIVSAPFMVVHNIPDYFVMQMDDPSVLPVDGYYDFTAGITQNIKISAFDTYGNPANRFSGNRVLTFSGAVPSPNPGEVPRVNSTNFPGATTLNFVDGVVTAALTLYKEELVQIATNYTAAYTDSYVNGNININASDANRLPVRVRQNTPAYFSVTIAGNLTEVTAGQSYTVTVSAFDHYNNPATFYTGNKELVFTGAGVSPAPSTSPTIGGEVIGNSITLNFNSNGQATASMILYKAEQDISISVAETELDGVQTRIGYKLDLDVNHGAAAYFAVTGTPGAMTAGTTQVVTVTTYDTWNNLATAYAGDKAIVFSGAIPSPDNAPANGSAPTVTNKSASAISFGTTTMMTFASGAASGIMALYKEEDIHISATQGSITTPVITGYDYRLAVNVGHAAANYFAVTGTNSTMTAGTSQTITATLYDVYNNIATTYDGAHDLTFTGANVSELNNTPTLATVDFGSTTSLVFADGIASGTMFLYKAENAAIKVSNGSQSTSNSFDWEVTVNPNVAHNLAITTQPAHSTTEAIAGIAFSTQPVVRIRDIYGNLVVSDNTTVITAATGSTGTDSLFGSSTATSSAGVASFAGLNYQKAEDMNILFSSGSLQTVTSSSLSVVHNVPTYMTISGASTQTAGVSQTITVRAFDEYNNLALRFDGSKALTFSGANVSPSPSTNPTVSATAFGSATSLNFTDGVATGSMNLYKEETTYVIANHTDAAYADSYTGAANLLIAAANPNGLEVVVSQAAPAYFAISGNGTQIAGTSQTITVRAYDAFNNLTTDYTGSKMLRFSGANESLTPSTNPTVSAIAFGNNTALTFTDGVATMDMTLYKDEVAVIIATEISGGTAGQTNGTVGITTPDNVSGHVYRLTVDVNPNDAYYFAVTGNSTQTAGDAQTITVTAYDQWNNVALGYSDSKSLTFSGASSSPGSPKAAVSPTVAATAFGSTTSLSFTSGVATGSMILTLVETAYIKVQQGSIATSDDYDLHVVVNHAANNYFAVTGNSTQTAGVAQTINVTMYDAYNNIATAYDGTKSLLFSGAVASLYGDTPTVNSTNFGSATNVVFSAGVANTAPSASMILTNAVSTTVTVSGDGINTAAGLGLTVNVGHNLATNLRIDQQPSSYVRAGDALAQQPVISIRDAYGNLVDDDATEITASANGNSQLMGSRTLTAFDGVVNFSGLNYTLMETITIGFTSSPALTARTSNAVVVDHNATYKFEFTTVPAYIIAGGQRGAYVVNRYDAYDNLVNNVVNSDGTDNNIAETVYLYTDGSVTSPFVSNFYNALAAGSIITNINIANNATSASFWYYSTNAGEHLITGSNVTPLDNPDAGVINAVHNTLEVRPAALSHFIVSGIGTNVGSGWTEHYYGDVQSVTVEAIDILGNRKTNYSGSITFNVTDNLAVVGTNYPNDYTFSAGEGAGFDNGIHTFTNAVIFTRPSFEHVNYPAVNEWWVTAVDMAQPTKYGSQVKIKVLARPITVTAHNQTKNYYGDTHSLGTSSFTVTSSLTNIYAYSESVTSVTLTSSGTVNTATVGDYNIVPSNATGINSFNPNYYTITYVNGTLSVERRPITIATIGTQSKTYGDADPGSYGYSVTSPLGLTAWDQWSGVLTRELGENVGFYNMLISGSSLTIVQTDNTSINKAANYDISFVNTNQFEITRKPITLTPVAAQHKTYGDVNPTYTYTTSPAINSLLANGHTVDLTGVLTRESGENVATYKILQGTIDNTQNPNYDVTFTEDVLFTINRLPITVTANTGQNKVYGQLDPSFGWTANPVIGHELANGYIVSLDGVLSRVSGEDVDLYAIQQHTITNTTNPNYDVTFVSKNFEITRLPIALTPNSGQKKTYGDSDPLPYTYTTVPSIGTTLANGRQVTLSGDLTREDGHVVGFYNILQGEVTNTTNGNYNISYTSNVKFEIERKNIAINVIAGQTKEYGDVNPTYTYTTTPAENALPFNAEFIGALVRETGENVATDYTITQGTLELDDDNNPTASLAQNYNITFTSADYAITRKAIAITVTLAQQKVYGESDPSSGQLFAFTTVPSLASLPFQAASWTGALLRETGEVVGTEYTITQGSLELVDGQNALGGSLATNYTVTFNTADFEITRKPITITVDEGIAKTYGDNDPGFTFTTSPVLGSLPFGAAWVGNLVRLNSNNNIATYAITQGSLELTDNNNGTASLAQNYTVNYVGNNLTINKRNITIAVTAGQNKVYAANDPLFAYTSSVDPLYYNGSFNGPLSRNAGENVATNYAIGRGDLQIIDDNNATSLDANYNMTFVPANFAIIKKPITIMVVAGQNKRYGFADPTSIPEAPIYFRAFEFESSVNPLPFGGDFIGALERTGVSSSPVGTYAISRGSLNINDANNNTTSLDDNYQITFTGSDFTINERLLTLVATDRTKTYGFGPEWGIADLNYWTLGSTQFTVSSTTGDGMAYSETIGGVGFTSSGEPRDANTGTYSIAINAGSESEAGGFLKSNYDISYVPSTLTITPRTLHLSNFAADNKVYNGSATASGLGFFDDRVNNDNLSFTRTAVFDDANAGSGKTVTYTSVLISGGTDQNNYVLESETSHWKTAANRTISQKPLTITANSFTKYFGNTYTFTGTEFTTTQMVTGESVASASLSSDGAVNTAPINHYSIVISDPLASVGTLLSNYSVSLVNGDLNVIDPLTILGKVYYYKRFNISNGTRADMPMQGVSVKLYHSGTGSPAITTTDSQGVYQFNLIAPNTVTKVEVGSSLAWGSVSANDALAMQLKIVQSPPTYWQSPAYNVDFMNYVADINNSTTLSIQDVLGTKYRILNPSYQFPAGNWRFYAEGSPFTPLTFETNGSASLANPILDGNNYYPNIYARVVGDMDGDFNPNPSKELIPIQVGEALVVNNGEYFDMDIRVKDALKFAATSLTLQFDDTKLEVESLSSLLPDHEYIIEGNQIRIVWTSLSSVNMDANDVLITLNMRTISPVTWTDQVIFHNSNSVFGDELAEMISGVEIIAPPIENNLTGLIGFDEAKLSLSLYPNPAKDWVNVNYSLPASAEVKIILVDMMGVTVSELIENELMTGTYSFRFNTNYMNLDMGVYSVRMHVKSNGKSYVRNQKLVHIK